MDVKLKVLSGSNAGREIKIPVPKFIIGRGDDCHLRPKSDLISRQHCAIIIEETKVSVLDMSKNGTFVNDERISGQREVMPGDKVRIGQLQFEIVVGTTLAAAKKPKVKDVRDAAVRTVTKAQSNSGSSSDIDVMGWLEDEAAATGDTQRFYMADTSQIIKAAADSVEKPTDDLTIVDKSGRNSGKTKEYGKLPPPPVVAQPKDSREAALEALRKHSKR